jgi:hypothetical protein
LLRSISMLVGGLGRWRGVGESGVQIFQRFASGLPKSSKQKKGQGGWDAAAIVQREEKEVAG